MHEHGAHLVSEPLAVVLATGELDWLLGRASEVRLEWGHAMRPQYKAIADQLRVADRFDPLLPHGADQRAAVGAHWCGSHTEPDGTRVLLIEFVVGCWRLMRLVNSNPRSFRQVLPATSLQRLDRSDLDRGLEVRRQIGHDRPEWNAVGTALVPELVHKDASVRHEQNAAALLHDLRRIPGQHDSLAHASGPDGHDSAVLAQGSIDGVYERLLVWPKCDHDSFGKKVACRSVRDSLVSSRSTSASS